MDTNDVLGVRVNQCDSVDEFIEQLQKIPAARLHTFFQSGLFGLGSNWSATFAKKGSDEVFGYGTTNVGDDFEERVEPIYSTAKALNISDVDGMVNVSPDTGSIYHKFLTENPDERAHVSFNDWKKAVSSLVAEKTTLQYLVGSEAGTLVDATNGKHHYITSLDGEGGRTIQEVLDEFAYLPNIQDNTPVLAWYGDLQ